MAVIWVAPLATKFPGRGGGDTWVQFCWVCALASQSPCPIIVYFVASYRPHLSDFSQLSHFLFIHLLSITECNAR